jgi:hypothetical protein
MQSVNATSLKANFVGNFVRTKTCVKRTRMKSNQKIKCLSRSPLSTLKISCQSEYVWISKNRSECTALMLDEK